MLRKEEHGQEVEGDEEDDHEAGPPAPVPAPPEWFAAIERGEIETTVEVTRMAILPPFRSRADTLFFRDGLLPYGQAPCRAAKNLKIIRQRTQRTSQERK